MVKPDRQQSTAGSAWSCRCTAGRAVYGLYDIKDYASIRGRLGVAFDRWLLFGTGGWAWGNPAMSYALLGSAPLATNGGNTSSGWTVGAGLEYALTDHVLGRIEYRYTDLATPGFVNAAANLANAGQRAAISDTRLGFAYKFAGGAPL